MDIAQITKLIQERRAQVEFLFQRYQIFEPVNMGTIQAAGKKFGATFLTDLATLLKTPPMEQNSIGMFMPMSAGADPVMGEQVIDTGTTSGGGWAGWDFLSNLINTGYQVYKNEKGQPVIVTNPTGENAAGNIAGLPVKTWLMIMGAAIFLMILLLIVKK